MKWAEKIIRSEEFQKRFPIFSIHSLLYFCLCYLLISDPKSGDKAMKKDKVKVLEKWFDGIHMDVVSYKPNAEEMGKVSKNYDILY